MTEELIIELVKIVLGVAPLSVKHMVLGHSSRTYDITLPERNVIVCTQENAAVFAYTESNIARLAQAGLPVPQVIASDLTMIHFPWAYMILKKIPGYDLRYELSSMTHEQMTCLAEQIVGFQRRVMGFPRGTGYGFIALGEQGPYPSWYSLVEQVVDRSLKVVCRGPLRVAVPDPLEQKPEFAEYLRQVPPICF